MFQAAGQEDVVAPHVQVMLLVGRDAQDIRAAARGLFYSVCPGEPEHVDWEPSDEAAAAAAEKVCDSYVTLTVLFLSVQQFAENLRQSTHFKKRTWQYLASALPPVVLHDIPWDMDISDSEWGPFCQRCQQVCGGMGGCRQGGGGAGGCWSTVDQLGRQKRGSIARSEPVLTRCGPPSGRKSHEHGHTWPQSALKKKNKAPKKALVIAQNADICLTSSVPIYGLDVVCRNKMLIQGTPAEVPSSPTLSISLGVY